MIDYSARNAGKTFGGPVSAAVLALLLCFSICPESPALSLGKKAKQDDNAFLTVPKIKLTREQQSEFDTSLKNGDTYMKSNNYELALICFMRCTTLDPSSAEAQRALAACYIALHKPEQAQSAIFDALRCDPNNVATRFLLGQMMIDDKRFDEGGGQFLLILKQEPENLAARGNLATCLQMMGQVDPAIGQYKYILAKDPKNTIAAMNLAACYDGQHMYEEAAQYYKRVIECDPKNSHAYCSMAKCLIAKKDYKSSQVLLDHALKIAPTNYFVHLMRGYLYEVQHERRGAIEEYTKAVALAPHDPDSQKSLTRMLENGIGSPGGRRIGTGGSLSVSTH